MIGIIVTTVIFGIVLAVIAVWYLIVTIFDEFAMHGLRAYTIDAEKLLYREFEQGPERPWILRTIFYRSFLPVIREWSSIATLSKLFEKSEGERVLRQALHDLTKRPEQFEVKFQSALPGFERQAFRNGVFDVVLRFNQVEDSTYVLSIKWTRQFNSEFRITARSIKQISREEIANYRAKVTGYLAFNSSGSSSSRALLVRTVVHVWREPLAYFVDGALVVFVFQGKSMRKVETKVGKFVEHLRASGFLLRASLLFSGSAFVASEGGHLPNKQANSLQVLEFLISVSIVQNRDFISINEYRISNTEYKLFYDSLRNFKAMIQEKTFALDQLPVKRYPDNKPYMTLIRPRLQNLSPQQLDYILSNANYRVALIDATATRAFQERGIKNAFLDVNLDWLAANRAFIKNRQIVYVINLQAFNDEELLKTTVEYLNASGIPFGFRLPYHDGEIEKLISLYGPQYIIIARSLIGQDGVFSSSEFISALAVASYAELNNATVVYEGLPLYINESIAQKIALRYYY